MRLFLYVIKAGTKLDNTPAKSIIERIVASFTVKKLKFVETPKCILSRDEAK